CLIRKSYFAGIIASLNDLTFHPGSGGRGSGLLLRRAAHPHSRSRSRSICHRNPSDPRSASAASKRICSLKGRGGDASPMPWRAALIYAPPSRTSKGERGEGGRTGGAE